MSNKENKTKVIFFAPILEYPPAGGPQLSVVNAVKVLNRISELHIFTTVSPDLMGPEAIEFFRNHSHALMHTPTSRWNSRQPSLNKWMRRTRRLLAPFFAWFDVRCIMLHAKKHHIQIFWIDRVLEHAFSMFRMLRHKLPDAIVVGDTESVYSRFILRELPMISNPFRWLLVWLRGNKTQREERFLVTQADVVTAVSDVDIEFFRQIGNDKGKVMRFSNVVDLEEYENFVQPYPRLQEPCALLLGSFGHVNSPMDRAARWVAEDIMPIVWESIPEAHLYIIGRNSDITQAGLKMRGITVVGQVPSVVPYLQQAALTLVPLRFESGTRFKIVESGAAAVACVSTTLGAEGLDVKHGENILIADETQAFADAMVSVLSSPNLQQMLGSNLRDLIQQNYSLEKQTKEGLKILKQLGVYCDAKVKSTSANK
jgi:glycosyltransferase involved in cell wall biosynthesis